MVGSLSVPTEGVWTIKLTADDGLRLYIDDAVIASSTWLGRRVPLAGARCVHGLPAVPALAPALWREVHTGTSHLETACLTARAPTL